MFVIGTLLQSETLDLIHAIVESSDFQHCTILCTVPENVHCFARHVEIGEISPFGEISQKLREWMGNMVGLSNWKDRVENVEKLLNFPCFSLACSLV